MAETLKKFNANDHENDRERLTIMNVGIGKAETLWNEQWKRFTTTLLLKKITVFKTVENVRLFFSVVQVK